MEHFGYLIKRLDKYMRESFDRELCKVDLTFSQMRVLRFLEEHEQEKITQKDISEELEIKHSTTIGLLKRMQEKELVTVVVDEQNHRCRVIQLTHKAGQIHSEMEHHRAFMEDKIVHDFTEQEKTEFRRLLNKAIENLSKGEKR